MALKIRELFRERVMANGGFAAVAKALGVTRQHLYAIAKPNGTKPGRALANSIELLLGVPAGGWDHIDGEMAA